MVHDSLNKHSHFVIYGAQVVAYGAYTAIKHLYSRTPEAFVVSNMEGNPAELDGIPVRTLDTISKDTLIIVAVTELLQDEIVKMLEERGYAHTFRLTAHEEHVLMSTFFDSIDEFPLLDSNPRYEPAGFTLYEVKSHRDKPLANHPELKSFERSIQAGAALTKMKIAPILDNTGKNISAKNKQYCEMSAVYWVWKNTDHAWKGVEHYRRHLHVIPELLYNDIDAVMPLPYICYPSTRAQLLRFISEDVLRGMLHVLKVLHADKYDEYVNILNGKYQYTYNLVCAKREVFDAYCTWFFEITEYMETLGIDEIANTRALSYVAEALTNIYFMSNRNTLRIKHVEKEIYV